jgi:hypothetical protein
MKIWHGILMLAAGALLAFASSAASHTSTKTQATARLHHSAMLSPSTGTDRPYPTVPSYPGIYGTIPSYASGLPGYGTAP